MEQHNPQEEGEAVLYIDMAHTNTRVSKPATALEKGVHCPHPGLRVHCERAIEVRTQSEGYWLGSEYHNKEQR